MTTDATWHSAAKLMESPSLLLPWFKGKSWQRWLAVLRAAEGLPLTVDQDRLFREIADREPPKSRVRELWAAVGRGGGKDSVASAVAAAASLNDYSEVLRPGEQASVMCLAVDKRTARIVFQYTLGYFLKVPEMGDLLLSVEEADGTIKLKNDVEIIITTNDYRNIRGRRVVCAILDELAFWPSSESARADIEAYWALRPALGRTPGSMLVAISSTYRRSGLFYDQCQRFYGKPDAQHLVVHGTTLQFNPNFDREEIKEAQADDPERASAEYSSEWRSDIADPFNLQALRACVEPGLTERPPEIGIPYAAFVDPASGSSGDSMTLAIAHVGDENGEILADLAREWRPPFSPEAVVAEISEILRRYGIARLRGDRFATRWVAEAFAKHGIFYEQSAAPKSDQYRDFLPLLAAERVRLPDDERMISQFAHLRRQSTPTGREIFREPKNFHDDLANAVAGAVTMVAADSHTGQGLRTPTRRKSKEPRGLSFLFSVFWVAANGSCATVTAGCPSYVAPDEEALFVLSARRWRRAAGTTLPEACADLRALFSEAQKSRARGTGNVWFWAPRAWRLAAERALGEAFPPQRSRRTSVLARVEEIDEALFLARPEPLFFAGRAHFEAQDVAFSERGLREAEKEMLFGTLGWSPAGRERFDEDPLRVAALLAVSFALDVEGDPLARAS